MTHEPQDGPDSGQPNGGAESPTAASETKRPAGAPPPKWPAKRMEVGRVAKFGNAVMTGLTRWGVVPHTYVMTTVGRKTGKPRSIPVTIVEKGDSRWLVAPYGPVSWVLNVRAAGRVTLTRRGQSHVYAVEEVAPDKAGPVLKEYLQIAGATKSYFEATKGSPVADFTAEASRHPVFALSVVSDPRG